MLTPRSSCASQYIVGFACILVPMVREPNHCDHEHFADMMQIKSLCCPCSGRNWISWAFTGADQTFWEALCPGIIISTLCGSVNRANCHVPDICWLYEMHVSQMGWYLLLSCRSACSLMSWGLWFNSDPRYHLSQSPKLETSTLSQAWVPSPPIHVHRQKGGDRPL